MHFQIKDTHLFISYFDYFTSLTCHEQTVLVSCFNSSKTIVLREECVSLSDGPVTCLCVGPTAFCCTFSFAAVFYFISHFFKMCANTGGISPHTSRFITHLPSFHTLRDREQWFLHTIVSLRLISW